MSERLGDVALFAVSTMVKRLVDHTAATGSAAPGLHSIIYGGGPMYVADLVKGIDVLGPRFVQLYGWG